MIIFIIHWKIIFETADIHSGIDLKFNELGDLVLDAMGICIIMFLIM